MQNEECRMKNTNTMSKVKCILHSLFFILHLKSNSEECADAPFDVVNGKTLFVADIGEIENH